MPGVLYQEAQGQKALWLGDYKPDIAFHDFLYYPEMGGISHTGISVFDTYNK